MQEPLFLIRNNIADWQRLYQYFVQAEDNQAIVTSVSIQQVFPCTPTGETEDLDTVRWYMYHYWRWFLFCVNDAIKPYEYRCKRIKGYPLEYFLQAHTRPNHMKYFAHFVRSMETDKELRKAAQGRGTPRKPRSPETPVQLPLGVDELGGREQEEEGFIPVDTHGEEEEPVQAPDLVFEDEESDHSEREVDEPEEQTGEEEQEHEEQVDVDEQEPEDTQKKEPSSSTDEHTPPPVMSSPLSGTRRSRISPVLVASLIVGACVVVGLVLYFISRQR